MGKNLETVKDFTFLGSKITVDDDCSHVIKRCLILGRKSMRNRDSILKSRDITLLTEFHIVRVMVFPVVMYRCDSWTVNKADHQRIDVFKLWCWRKLLRVPWTARRSNHFILKNRPWIFIGRIDAEVKASILCPLHLKSGLIKKYFNAGKDWRQEEKRVTENNMFGWHQWLNGHKFEYTQGNSEEQCEAWHAAVHGVTEWDNT